MPSFYELQCRHLPCCAYCDQPATTVDHVPPRCVRPSNTFTVPACRRCNCEILGGIRLLTVEERREYVQKRLAAKQQASRKAAFRKAFRRPRGVARGFG